MSKHSDSWIKPFVKKGMENRKASQAENTHILCMVLFVSRTYIHFEFLYTMYCTLRICFFGRLFVPLRWPRMNFPPRPTPAAAAATWSDYPRSIIIHWDCFVKNATPQRSFAKQRFPSFWQNEPAVRLCARLWRSGAIADHTSQEYTKDSAKCNVLVTHIRHSNTTT